jgi:methyl-accepting chemotaxis protein
MLGKLKLGPKLLLAPCTVLILLLALSVGAWYGMLGQNRSLDYIVQQRAARIKAAADLVAGANRAHTEIYQLLSWSGASFSSARIDALAREIYQRHGAIERQFDALIRATQAGGPERRFIEQAEAAHMRYAKAISDVIDMVQMDRAVGMAAMSKAERAFDQVAQRLDELSRFEQQLSERAVRDAQSDFAAMEIVMAAVVVVSIALSLLITMAVRHALLREVGEIGAAARDLATGNLAVKNRSYGGDEIADAARALDMSIGNLNTTLKSILASAHSVEITSRELTRTNLHLSHSTQAQSGALERAGASLRALRAAVSQAVHGAQTANRLAAGIAAFALRRGDVLERLVLTMASVRHCSRRVIEIAGAFDAIAGQANVLALNGAVEAAHAGEHGRGFAVVAAEVRALARHSAGAARKIRQLAAQSVDQIDAGSACAQQAGGALVDMAASVRQLGDLVRQLGGVSADPLRMIVDVNASKVQLNQLTLRNCALVRQTAAAAVSMQHQAQSLSKAVAGFTLDENAAPPLPQAGRAHLRLAAKRE